MKDETRAAAAAAAAARFTAVRRDLIDSFVILITSRLVLTTSET